MKLSIASLTILCLALAAVPVAADLASGYDNGFGFTKSGAA